MRYRKNHITDFRETLGTSDNENFYWKMGGGEKIIPSGLRPRVAFKLREVSEFP